MHCLVIIVLSCHHWVGPALNISVESSTSTSISLKWTGADDRVNYYSAIELYLVEYVKNGVQQDLLTIRQHVTVPGLEPDTEYTFFLRAIIVSDYALGPRGNLTSRTQKTSESYE